MNATNTSTTEITAIVLAGGASSRMQQPKALLPWRGQRFIDHIVRQLREQVSQIAISAPLTPELQTLNLPLLPDPFAERRGPLAGILAGLRFAQTPLALFVPCDSPRLPTDLAARLHGSLMQHSAEIAYAVNGADAHYLYVLLRCELREALALHLQRGDYAVRRWFATRHTIAVSFDDAADCFLNINTPADLQKLQPRNK